MAISRVSSAESIRTGTQDPYTFSFNVSAAAKAIVIGVIHTGTTPLVTGLTIGGQTMTELTWFNGTGIDTAGEQGLIRFWELTSNIPSAGSQTVSATGQGANTADIFFIVWELTANGDIVRLHGGGQAIQGDIANPTINALASGDFQKITLCLLYSGAAAPGGTIAAGNTLDHTHDFGNFMAQTSYETTPDADAHTAGWSTLGSDDVAMGIVEYYEVFPLDQAGFRWRNDDGDEDGATWMAAENTDPTDALPYDQNVRIRFVVENDGANDSTDTALALQYKKNAGGWLNVTASSTNVRSAASPNLADGTATTRQLTSGTGTFTAGEFDEVDGATASTFDLPAGNLTEVEFCVQFRNADLADGDVIELRVGHTLNSALFGTYDQDAGPVSFPFAIPMVYPFGLSDAGPIRVSSGNYYYGLRGGSAAEDARDLRVWKSEDDCASWVLLHTFQGLEGDNIEDVTATVDANDIVHFFWHSLSSSDDHYWYAAWDGANDTVEVDIEEAFAHTESVHTHTRNGIVVRSDGVVVVTYTLATPIEAWARRRVSGTWQSAQLLDTDFTTPHAPSLVLDPDTDDVHFFWHGWSSGGSGIKHRVLRASDNSLSTTDVITTTGTSQQRPAGCGIAAGRLFVAQLLVTTGDILAWHSDTIAEAPTWNSTNFSQGVVENDAASTARSWMIKSGGGRIAIAWVLQSGLTLHYRQWDEDIPGWASQVDTGDTLTLDGAIINTSVTHDGSDVTLWVASRSTSVTNSSGPVIRSFDLGPAILGDNVNVPLVTAPVYIDTAGMAVTADSNVTAKTADAAIDASNLQAGISATTALVTADAAITPSALNAQASSSPQAVTADQVIDATPKAQSASSSVAIVTADQVQDATPKQQSASSTSQLVTADQVQDATPQAQSASSAPTAVTADAVITPSLFGVESDQPVDFTGDLVTADAYLDASLLAQQASTTSTAVTADAMVDSTPSAQSASSAPQAVTADLVIDASQLAATTEQVTQVALVTADVVIEGFGLAQQASTTTTAVTADLVIDASQLVVSAEITVTATLTTSDFYVDSPTLATSVSGAPIAETADVFIDAPPLALETSTNLLAVTGDYFIDSASGLGLSFLMLRREEGQTLRGAGVYSGRIKGEQNQSSRLALAGRQEGNIK